MKREVVRIYRSKKKAEAYIYMAKSVSFDTLPDQLKALFGQPEVAMDMLLTEDKKLARAQASDILESIEEKGFYLQMPPPKEDYMLDLYREKDRSDHG